MLVHVCAANQGLHWYLKSRYPKPVIGVRLEQLTQEMVHPSVEGHDLYFILLCQNRIHIVGSNISRIYLFKQKDMHSTSRSAQADCIIPYHHITNKRHCTCQEKVYNKMKKTQECSDSSVLPNRASNAVGSALSSGA